MGLWVRCAEFGECPWASWGDTQVRRPQWLMDKPPNGISDAVSRTGIPLIHSFLSPGCCSPSCLPNLSHVVYNSVFRICERQMHCFAATHRVEYLSAHLHAPSFPHGKTNRQSRSFLALSYATVGER